MKELKVLFIDNLNVGPYLRDTLLMDKITTTEEAMMEIYRRVRPGDPPTPETATNSSPTCCSSTPSATTCRRSVASS
jgi:DNA-directed RNA polymerase subunit beta